MKFGRDGKQNMQPFLILRGLHNARICNPYRNRAVPKYALNEMAELLAQPVATWYLY